MAWIRIVVLLLVVAAALLLVAGRLGMLSGKTPQHLGVREGKLRPPSRTPNSVSSQADQWPDHPQRDYARIAPLPLKGDGATTMAALKRAVSTLPGATVRDEAQDYLYVTCTTPLLRFTDDLELWIDPNAAVVQVRSSSRLGRKDFGVNRQRVEALRAAYAAL